MILFRRHFDPRERWWKYAVEHPDAQGIATVIVRPFITAQGALQFIADRFPNEYFRADTREPAVIAESEERAVYALIAMALHPRGEEIAKAVAVRLRDTEEARDFDRWEEARSDAREDARLEREES